MSNNQDNQQWIEESSDQIFSLVDLLHVVISNWKWFVISIVICCGIAIFYLKSTPPIYTRAASVLIKDDSKGGAISESAAFEELSMFNVKRNVDNEILVFKSQRLMRETIKKLNIDISYTVKQGLRTIELYTQSPVFLSFPETDEIESFSFSAKPLSQNEIELSDFRVISEFGDEQKINKTVKALLNDTIESPVGRLVVVPTLYYGESYFHTPIVVKKSNQEKVITDYQNALQVSLASKTATIINLTLEDVSILRAEDILNTLISVYNADVINDKNQVAVNTSNFINDRLIIIEQELGTVDSDIEMYKREHQLTDIRSESGMYLQATTQFNQEEMGLENQLSLAKYIKEYLIDPGKNSDLIPANTGISDVNIEGQIGEYNELLLKRDKLISNSSDKNPVVMDLNNSLNAMKQAIIRAVDNLIVGLNIKVQNVRQREAQTARRIAAVPTQQKDVLSIERQQKIKEELYLYLLNKREENALSQAITGSNARIVDAASGDSIPVAPKSSMVLLGAFLLGCLLPGGYLWFRNILDTKVHIRKDIEDATTIPLLGEIPQRNKKDTNEIVVKENSRDAISEAFRIVRTNMDFMRVKSKEMKVVMFTSSNPSAGKTFVSTNLAMSIALMGKKVVLVDLDIRKGTLSERTGIKGNGVTNYLSGKVEKIEDIIQSDYVHSNLDLIQAGPVPPNPAELLLSERLDEMISQLKERYDYIILDTVPAGMVADASIINRLADLTIYLVRAEKMDRRQLPDLERLYRQKKFNNLCIILNGIDYGQTGYKYGYGYSYGYGYTKDDMKSL